MSYKEFRASLVTSFPNYFPKKTNSSSRVELGLLWLAGMVLQTDDVNVQPLKLQNFRPRAIVEGQYFLEENHKFGYWEYHCIQDNSRSPFKRLLSFP